MRFFLLTILLLTSSFALFGQTQDFIASTVSLEYVCHNKNQIRLRLVNRTDWAVIVDSEVFYHNPERTLKLANGKEGFAAPNDKEISLRYYVEKFALPREKVKVPQLYYTDSFFTTWIAPNDSAMFAVPIEYLKENLQVFIRVNYEWEATKNGAVVSQTEHRVSFRGIDIPEQTKACPYVPYKLPVTSY